MDKENLLILKQNILKSGSLEVKIESADVWAYNWIAYQFYKLADKEEITIHIKAKKSKHSIDGTILIIFIPIATEIGRGVINNITDRAIDNAIDRVIDKIWNTAKRWKEKRKQTSLKIFIQDDEVK